MRLSFTVPRISILLFHITTNLPTTTSSGQQFTTTDITYYQPEPLYSNQTVLIYDDNRDLVTKIGPKKLILNEKQQSQTNTFSQIPGENCGNPESPFRVIGGSEAYEGEYPWMVRLQPCQCESENCENYSSCFTCGGSIISKDFILTAAHCVDLESNGKFGFWNHAPSYIFQKSVNTDQDKLGIQNVLFFEEILVPEKWLRAGSLTQQLQSGSDIALVKFQTADGTSNSDNLDNNLAWPICLPETDLCLHGGGFALSIEQNPIEFSKIHESLKRTTNSGKLRKSGGNSRKNGEKNGEKNSGKSVKNKHNYGEKMVDHDSPDYWLNSGRKLERFGPVSAPEDSSEMDLGHDHGNHVQGVFFKCRILG